jgi:hypothetical protein
MAKSSEIQKMNEETWSNGQLQQRDIFCGLEAQK